MKKFIVSLSILSALGLLVYHLPRLLDFRPVRAQVAAKVSAATGWQVAASRLRWEWFPSPHLSLGEISMSRGGITFFIPETRIAPRWLSLLRQQVDLGELKLVRPRMTVTAWPPKDSQPPPELPRLNITIVEGSALITAPPFAEGSASARSPLMIDGINSRLRLTPEHCDLKLTCASSLFAKLELKGAYRTIDRSYQLDYGLTGLDLGNLVPDLLGGRLRPKIAGLSLQGKITGQGLERFLVKAAGDFPCFLFPRSPEKNFLDCGEFALTIDKNPQSLAIDIAKLQLKNPATVLSGRIAVSRAVLQPSPIEGGTAAPLATWLVDLSGQNLDVSAIRQTVLDLFGDHHVAQLVCDIVRGGAANRASYYFQGPLADFEHLEKMLIKVDVERAEIHPPGTRLELKEVGGPIEIRDGFLSGAKLRARLGNSVGSKGSLYLDLLERKHEFRLDLEIEADLADLPQVLLDEVHHQDFQAEVRRFRNCRGRAHGRLNIGDTLVNPLVTVLVDRMEGGGEYDRISSPFSISQGTLAVYPDRLSWQGVKGAWGPQLVHDSSGEVDWNGPVKINRSSLDATLDLAPLHAELSGIPAIATRMHKVLSGARGPVELRNAAFSGSIKQPESWRYSCSLASSGSRWISPLLPQPFWAENLSATIDQEMIKLEETRLRFLEQPLTIQGNFLHSRLEEWRGWASFSGTIEEKLAGLIRSKGWIPAEYFPRIPCTLDKLRIEWDELATGIIGTVKAGTGGPGAPEVHLDLSDTAELFTVKELAVTAPPGYGKLTLRYPKDAPSQISLNWQGVVDSSSILTLLSANIIHAQHLEGNFALRMPLRPGGNNLQGWLKIRGLEWAIGDAATPVVLNDLNLRGQNDGTLIIERALIDSRDSRAVEINGTINPAAKQLDFKLNLTADVLARTTVEGVIRGMSSLAAPADPADPDKKWPSRGTLQFMIGQFEPGPAADPGKPVSPGSSYVLAPAKGFLTLRPSGGYSLDLRSSRVCGVDISGTIYSAPEEGENSLNFFTDSAKPQLLQEVIPCLGFSNTMIEGPLHLDGSLQGTTRNWRDGKISLYSEKGFIRRLGFLAKVFSVVNLTDLFTTQPLPKLGDDGFAYSSFEIESRIRDNQLLIEKAVVKGTGLNLFGQGKIDLQSGQADLIIMVAPLKTIDALITHLPLIGPVAGGKDQALLSIPVGLKGDLRDPSVTLLPPEAIGEGIVNLIINTFKLPLAIFSPFTNINR